MVRDGPKKVTGDSQFESGTFPPYTRCPDREEPFAYGGFSTRGYFADRGAEIPKKQGLGPCFERPEQSAETASVTSATTSESARGYSAHPDALRSTAFLKDQMDPAPSASCYGIYRNLPANSAIHTMSADTQDAVEILRECSAVQCRRAGAGPAVR